MSSSSLSSHPHPAKYVENALQRQPKPQLFTGKSLLNNVPSVVRNMIQGAKPCTGDIITHLGTHPQIVEHLQNYRGVLKFPPLSHSAEAAEQITQECLRRIMSILSHANKSAELCNSLLIAHRENRTHIIGTIYDGSEYVYDPQTCRLGLLKKFKEDSTAVSVDFIFDQRFEISSDNVFDLVPLGKDKPRSGDFVLAFELDEHGNRGDFGGLMLYSKSWFPLQKQGSYSGGGSECNFYKYAGEYVPAASVVPFSSSKMASLNINNFYVICIHGGARDQTCVVADTFNFYQGILISQTLKSAHNGDFSYRIQMRSFSQTAGGYLELESVQYLNIHDSHIPLHSCTNWESLEHQLGANGHHLLFNQIGFKREKLNLLDVANYLRTPRD